MVKYLCRQIMSVQDTDTVSHLTEVVKIVYFKHVIRNNACKWFFVMLASLMTSNVGYLV